MATLGELKTRIVTEMDREDLSEEIPVVLAGHIDDAIEFFSDEKFYFNSLVTRADCTAATVTMAIPSGIRRIDKLTIPSVYIEVREITLAELERLQDGVFAQPRYYAYYNDEIRFWPVPDRAYTLEFTGLAQIAAPASDADSNVWTTTCAALITNRAKMTLARDVFRDPDGVQLYGSAANESLKRLKRETARRLVAPRRMQNDGALADGRFNIYYD